MTSENLSWNLHRSPPNRLRNSTGLGIYPPENLRVYGGMALLQTHDYYTVLARSHRQWLPKQLLKVLADGIEVGPGCHRRWCVVMTCPSHRLPDSQPWRQEVGIDNMHTELQFTRQGSSRPKQRAAVQQDSLQTGTLSVRCVICLCRTTSNTFFGNPG